MRMFLKLLKKRYLILLTLFYTFGLLHAQVGINTTSPNGILDVNSNTHGIVLPRVSLSATNIQGPIKNPQGGNLAVGTVVYNTSETNTGSNDVYKGIYVWTGTEWFNKFTKKHSEMYRQSSFFQPQSTGGYQNIPGLTGKTFIPKYTGTYKIEISVNYGGGYILNASTGTDVGVQEGNFRFRFNGTDYIIRTKTNCTRTDTGTNYYAIWEQFSTTEYVSVTAGTPYNFELRFDQLPAPGFDGGGDSANGKGYIGIPDHVPCTIEYTYIGE